MAPVAAVLKGLATRQTRMARALIGAGTNHFLLFAGLIFATQPAAGAFLPVLIGLLASIPGSSDPWEGLPEARRALWPLGKRQRLVLRLAVWLASPVVWVAACLPLVWGRRVGPYLGVLLLWVGVLHLVRAGFRQLHARRASAGSFRWTPRIPGRLGSLVRKNVLELWRGLDVYLALLLSLTGLVYRMLSSRPVAEARFGLSLLVALALSTPAQRLFALEGEGSAQRYGLLPLSGWQVLLAKDLAFLITLAMLSWPLAPLPGFAAGLVVLAIGQVISARDRSQLPPWTFASSASLGWGALQVGGAFLAAGLAQDRGVWVLGPCLLLLIGGLFLGGRQLDVR